MRCYLAACDNFKIFLIDFTTLKKMAQWWLDWRRMFARQKEKIEITVETSESWEVQWFRQSKTECCPTCGAETFYIPPEIAAQVIRKDDEAIKNFLKSGQIHYGERAENETLICLSSLKKAAAQNTTRKILEDE